MSEQQVDKWASSRATSAKSDSLALQMTMARLMWCSDNYLLNADGKYTYSHASHPKLQLTLNEHDAPGHMDYCRRAMRLLVVIHGRYAVRDAAEDVGALDAFKRAGVLCDDE